MKIELKSPIKLGEHGEAITHLNLRESVCAGDLRGIKVSGLSDPSTDDLLKITSRLSGQPDAVLNKLELADFSAVLEAVSGFIEAGLKAGSANSP